MLCFITPDTDNCFADVLNVSNGVPLTNFQLATLELLRGIHPYYYCCLRFHVAVVVRWKWVNNCKLLKSRTPNTKEVVNTCHENIEHREELRVLHLSLIWTKCSQQHYHHHALFFSLSLYSNTNTSLPDDRHGHNVDIKLRTQESCSLCWGISYGEF